MNRDDNRCVITGWKDYNHGGSTVVQASYIVPEATNNNIDEERRKECGVVCNVSLPSINNTATALPVRWGLDNPNNVYRDRHHQGLGRQQNPSSREHLIDELLLLPTFRWPLPVAQTCWGVFTIPISFSCLDIVQ